MYMSFRIEVKGIIPLREYEGGALMVFVFTLGPRVIMRGSFLCKKNTGGAP